MSIALDCCDAIDKETMVDICLHDMANEYHVYIINLTFSSFLKFMEAIRRTNELGRRPQQPSIINRPGTMIVFMEKTCDSSCGR